MLIELVTTTVTAPQDIDNPYQAGLVADSPIDCINYTQVSNVNSAANVTAGAEHCALQENYTQAATLVMLASAYALNDTQWVTDLSAHDALNTVFATRSGPMSPDHFVNGTGP